jgi:Mg-chelatase subunit ChlD
MARQPAKPRKTTAASQPDPQTTQAAAPPEEAPPAKSKAPAKPRGRTKKQEAAPAAAQETRTRFVLYNLLGKERAYYLVERSELARTGDSPPHAFAHHIIVIDRSGSMYSALPPLKETLLKLLTLQEFANMELLVTLLSYASNGDVKIHFERAPIKQVMKSGSEQQGAIKKIQTAGCTCISQGLARAADYIKPDELTAITLHTDGYANDPSANAEAKRLEELCKKLSDQPVFMNTIAYSDYSDFRLLSKLANTVSGVCVKAKSGDVQTIFTSLNQTSSTIGGGVAPAIEEPLAPGYAYQVFVSHMAGKVLGSPGTLKVRGLKKEDDAVVYKFKKVSRQEYEALSDVPVKQTSEAVLAFAKAQLAEGNINTAKYALGSTFDATLTDRHSRALTNLQVAAMAVDLDTVLLQPGVLQEHEVLDRVKVNPNPSVLAVVRILEEHKNGFLLNFQHLQENYRRRGLRRLQGARDENGKLIEPWLKTEVVDTEPFVRVSSFDVNRNTATMNWLIARRVRLVPREGGAPITKVAGISLEKLSIFNNYTVVSDGEINVPAIQLKISDKALFDKLSQAGILTLVGGDKPKSFDANAEYRIQLDELPLMAPFEGAVDLTGLFDELASLKVVSSLMSAHLKEESDVFTPEQLDELKRHYLSKSLFLSFPTTTEYTDLQQALAEGSVDTRTSYKVDIGNKYILNLSKLHSANKFLDRMYELTDVNGQKIDKPSCEDLLDENIKVKHKVLSAKTKVTKIDDFMKPIFDDFLGLVPKGVIESILKKAGDTKLAEVLRLRRAGKVSRADYVAALTEAKKKVDAHAERLFGERVSPLVFYIGSTGLLPDEIEAKAQSAEEMQKKYPELAFSKDEAEGTYYEVGDAIIGIYAKTEYFSR